VLLVPLAVLARTSAAAAGPVEGLLDALLAVNVALVLFNLIPAFPMDGGRVLRALLALRLPYLRATRIASYVGQGAALVLGALGVLALHSWMLGLAALFVFVAAGEERRLVEVRSAPAGRGAGGEPWSSPAGPPGAVAGGPSTDATTTPADEGGRRQPIGY